MIEADVDGVFIKGGMTADFKLSAALVTKIHIMKDNGYIIADIFNGIFR